MGFLKNLHPRARIPKTFDDNIHRVLEDWVPLDLVEKIVENNFWVIGSKLDTSTDLMMNLVVVSIMSAQKITGLETNRDHW